MTGTKGKVGGGGEKEMTVARERENQLFSVSLNGELGKYSRHQLTGGIRIS